MYEERKNISSDDARNITFLNILVARPHNNTSSPPTNTLSPGPIAPVSFKTDALIHFQLAHTKTKDTAIIPSVRDFYFQTVFEVLYP